MFKYIYISRAFEEIFVKRKEEKKTIMCKQLLGIMPPAKKKAKLILQDGTEFEGYSFGAETSIGGEVGM